MKKRKSKAIFISGGVIIGVVAGVFISNSIHGTKSDSSRLEKEAQSAEVEKPTEQTLSKISQEEAEKIALAAVPGTIIRTELDRDDGITYYEVYIQTDSGVSEVYINANTGKIIEIDHENAPAENTNTGTMISLDEAKEIALAAVSGTVIRTELDRDNGITYYEIYIQTNSGVSEIYINANTGKIIEIDH